MMQKGIQLTILAIAVMLFAACSLMKTKGIAGVSYNSEKGIISVTLENMTTCNYVMKIDEYEIGSGTINEKADLNILSQLKNKTNICKDIALLAAKNNNELQVSLSLTDLLDTIFVYHITPTFNMQDDNVQFTGIGAKVVSKSASRNVDEELKRWLYQKHEVLNDSLFAALKTNYLFITETKNNDYVISGEIPVVHSLSGNKYSVTCSMVADFYAIVACREQQFLDKFVENSVVSDYKNLNTTKSNLLCVPEDNGSGYFCVTLLGINKDYSYQQLPICVVAVDNIAPTDKIIPGAIQGFTLKDNTNVQMPKEYPEIFGGAYVRVAHFDGNGLECNVTFLVTLSGDAKLVTIHRRGDLCYPMQYIGNHLPVADKTFYAKDGHEQRFTWKMHFDDGDNEIPITVEDYHGNRRDYNVIVRAEFVRNNSPQIDIDNNIDIYN